MGGRARQLRTAPEPRPGAGPQRTCVACRRSASKTELVRLAIVEARISVDSKGKASGRGAYLCRDSACWAGAERKNALQRALRVSVTAEDWQRLRQGILT